MKRLASSLICSFAGSMLPLLNCFASGGDTDLAYASSNSEFMALRNGVVLEGRDFSSLDSCTTGFRFTAGFSPWQLPQLDLGAEITYRESEEVPISSSVDPLIMDTLSLGGAIVAGVRMGAFSVYAKSGLTEWRGETHQPLTDDGGTAFLQGFDATMTIKRLVSRVEYEHIDAPTLSHLNMLSASLHLPF